MSKSKLAYTKLSAKQFSNLASSLLRDWTAARITVEDVVLTKLKTKLQEDSERYRKGISKVKDKVSREEVAELDQQRDRQLTLLLETVQLYRYATEPEVKTAYKLLSSLLKDAKKMRRANFVDESEYITGLLTQFKESNYQSHVQTLKLSPAITALTKSQEAFDVALQKSRSLLQAKEQDDLTALRKGLQELYQDLQDYLHVMATYSDKVVYKRLNDIFVTNQNAVKALSLPRKTSSKPKSKPSPSQPEEKEAPKPLPEEKPKA